MSFPVLSQRLDPLNQGDALTQPITLQVYTGTVPDPNTASDWRLSVTADSGETITVALADMVTPPAISTTSYGWSVVLLFPISKTKSRTLPAKVCTFQVDVEYASGQQALLVDGLIEVRTPTKPLP